MKLCINNIQNILSISVLFAIDIAISASAYSETMDSMNLAHNLGVLLASESFCGLSYDQDAINQFITKHVKDDDIAFPGTLQMMTDGAQVELKDMSPSSKTAHCTQVTRIAKSYKFIK